MLYVPSYQVKKFFDWLRNRKFQINNPPSIQNDQLLYYAKQFLHEYWERGFVKEGKDNPLLFILQVFQSCPMIKEASVIEQMDHFTNCGRCLRFIRISEHLKIGYPQKLYSLHPLLEDFLNYLNAKEFFREINFFDIQRSTSNHTRNNYFYDVIDRIGSQLFREFSQYIESVDQSLIEDYLLTYRSNHRISDDERRDNQGRRTKPLGVNEDLEEAANRLVASIVRDDSSYLALQQIVNSIKNFPQLLEFIEWLKKNHEDRILNQATSGREVKAMVTQFCRDLKYDNIQEFSGEIINCLSHTFIHKILNIFRIEIITKNRKPFVELPLPEFRERYESINFHGIFLFGENNNLSKFVKNHGRDLHDLTDCYIDIYYSQDDLKHYITGYQRRKQFRNLDIELSHIPAFIIWKDSLTNSQIISLEGLSHHQIFDVVKHITNGIEQKKSLNKVYEIATKQVESYLNPTSVIYNGGKFMINNGDTYNVEQAGAVGKYARSDNNTFFQSKEKQTLAEAAKEIQQLLKQLEQKKPTATESEKVDYVNDETTPSFKRRVSGALQAGGEVAIEEFLDNPYVNVGKAIVKAWMKTD